MKKTRAQTIYDTFKPKNRTFEEHRQILIDSGAYDEETLDTVVEVEIEDRRRKMSSSITPRVANWAGHDQIRDMIKSDARISDILTFLATILYERMQKAGGQLSAELVEKWRNKVDPLLDELHLDEAVKVSLEWFKKATTLGELNSKAMKAYLNTKTRGSKSEEVDSDNFFKEDDDKPN